MGKSGAVRTKSLDSSQLGAMETHENRADLVTQQRVVRNLPPLVFSPYSAQGRTGKLSYDDTLVGIVERDEALHLSIGEACARHLENTRRNKAAKKICLHSIVQFPTDLAINEEMETAMLAHAVAFIDGNFGQDAVFHARLDRDEVGRHAVDVFYAPRYIKSTKRRSETWVSLTKFGKALAVAQFGSAPKTRRNPKTGKSNPVLNKSGKQIEVARDSAYYQGQALQDAFHFYLQSQMRLDWAVRGSKKVSRDPDRLEVEEHKIKKDRDRQDQRMIEQNAIMERTAELASNARKLQTDRHEENIARLLEEVRALEAKKSTNEQLLIELGDQIAGAKKVIAESRALGRFLDTQRRGAEALRAYFVKVEEREAAKAQKRHTHRAAKIVCKLGDDHKEGFINAFSVLLKTQGDTGDTARAIWKTHFPDESLSEDIRNVRQHLMTLSVGKLFELDNEVEDVSILREDLDETRKAIRSVTFELQENAPWNRILRGLKRFGKTLVDAIASCVETLAGLLAKEEAVPDNQLGLTEEAKRFAELPQETRRAIEDALGLTPAPKPPANSTFDPT